MCFELTKRPLLFLMNIVITVYKAVEYNLILKIPLQCEWSRLYAYSIAGKTEADTKKLICLHYI